MPLIKIDQLDELLENNPDLKSGCIVDTNVLFGANFGDDIYHEPSLKLFSKLAVHKIPVLVNVNVRSEFIHQALRVVLPQALGDLFTAVGSNLSEDVYKKLKSVKTRLDRNVDNGTLFKMQSEEIKSVRSLLSSKNIRGNNLWDAFCGEYFAGKLSSEWKFVEEDFGLNFLTLRFSEGTSHLEAPLEWEEAVSIIENTAIGSADAMILNLFDKSKYRLLASFDSDLAYGLEKMGMDNKYLISSD